MARRDCLEKVSKKDTTNAGLWLDKFLRRHDSEGRERWKLIDEVISIGEPTWYPAWFQRWKDCLERYGARFREAKVEGRMVVGLGRDSVLETSILLHHTLGVPYIPGTALKGLASSFAEQRLGPEWSSDLEDCAHSIMFGTTDSAGYVTFFDAMPIPFTSKLFADVITVHHGDYYQEPNVSGKRVPPADWDDPNPVPFISASGKYLIALVGPEQWVDAAFAILAHALESMGVGAKTSSGYGRLSMDVSPATPPWQAEVDSYISQINALSKRKVAGSIHAYYEVWRDLEVPPEGKRELARAIVKKVQEAGRESQSRKKSWYQELLDSLQ